MQAFGALVYALGIDLFEDAGQHGDIPAEVRQLAQARWDAKKAKDWAKADELRSKIKSLGYEVFDSKDGFDIKKA